EIRMNWHKCEPLKEIINQAEINMGDQGRVLVRASGTEPLIRVMVEAANSDITNHYTDLLVNAVTTHLLG
ncbi:MAG TPA: phosphoglucosamine mutase, partial [Allocoleopsis sp.]